MTVVSWENALITAFATVLSVTITGIFAYLTNERSRAATAATATAAAKAQSESTHADLVKEAGEAAARVYKGAIERLEAEQREDRRDLDEMRGKLRHAEDELADARSELVSARSELVTARSDLAVARAALALVHREDDTTP